METAAQQSNKATEVSLHSPSPVRVGGKAKVEEHHIQTLGVGKIENWSGKEVDLKISELTGHTGITYFVSNTMHKGSFGKVRYAVDESGRKWVVKEVRTNEWVNNKEIDTESGRPPNPKTRVSKIAEVNKENLLMSYFGHTDVIKTNDGKVYTVMEAMDGEVETTIDKVMPTLPNAVRREVGLSLLEQYAVSLDKLHNLGWLHMDVKPANALVNRTGEIKIADFGYALEKNASGMASTFGQGTPGYLASEILRADPVDNSADTVSLGFSFCDMHVPWREKPVTHLMKPGQILGGSREFETWYPSLVVGQDASGYDVLDLSKIPQEGGNSWERYFNRVRSSAGDKMTAFVLSKMINPDRAKRVKSMLAIADVAKSEQKGAGSEECAAMHRMWHDELSANDNRDKVFDGLERYRKAQSDGATSYTRHIPLRPE